ncbi:hypothetical protein JCM19241_4053 [Vibrio ishigakensis]|uniref:Lysogenization regulator n=1 Tax=Vibrio ishigakensis TaxID=1481914 RepID=A0A0B8QCY4_9VIBR|nr:hypothetical protein JCM19241_4053 [Vibrio ishigakensis]
MANTNYDRTIAFAGICQAVALVQKVAQTGNCDSAAFETSISSIINMNPANTLAVFGHERELKLGLETLSRNIDSSATGNDLTRYIISLMALERKLSQRLMLCLSLRIVFALRSVSRIILTCSMSRW